MNQERLMQVLVEPRQSEKSTRVADLHRQYMFKVLTDATKPEIKAAVELMFKVEVESVTTSMVPSRLKMFRGRAGSGTPFALSGPTNGIGPTSGF